MEQKTVLVIEDDALNLKLVKEVLRVGKHRTLEAEDAETGIQMARENRPDLILMDIHLPRMDGLSATKMIRADEDLKHIPVVALTALAMPGDETKALEAGCVAYVTKPFQVYDLLKTIDQIMSHAENPEVT